MPTKAVYGMFNEWPEIEERTKRSGPGLSERESAERREVVSEDMVSATA